MDEADRLRQVFFDVQRGLPRQGPGDDESTLRALTMCTELPPHPDVLDVGCGPGMQTLALARVLDGDITAGDLCQEYLDELADTAKAAGVRARVGVMQVDMTDLPFGRDSFDLVWSEGAAYVMGFGEALAAWQPILRPRGYIAVTELSWLVPDPPPQAADLFTTEYPAMMDVATNLAAIEAHGYDIVGHFTVPDAAWWEHYYTPLEAKLPELRRKFADDDEALRVVERAAREIDIRRRYGDSYGYEFYVARAVDPDAPRSRPGQTEPVPATAATVSERTEEPVGPEYPPALD